MRRSLAQLVSQGLLAAAGLLAMGCASMNLASTEVVLPAPLDDACLEASLRAEPDVIGFRTLPSGGKPRWFFQLADPDLTYKEMPSFVASQVMVPEGPIVQVEANFVTRRGNGPELREAIRRREQQILSRALAACSAAEVEFGLARECGRGEKNSICVKGRLRVP